MEENESSILYQIKPKFNLIYELFMPTGRKIQQTLVMTLIFIIVITILNLSYNNIDIFSTNIGNYNLGNIINTISIAILVILLLKLALHIVFQILQYNFMKYTFYIDHMTYEDDFLNQHKKNIQYSNVKEVEIKRTVFDRIIGYGIIVIYTSAENGKSNGLVIYSVKNPKEHYQKIYDIVFGNTHNEIINKNYTNNDTVIVESVDKKEENFEDSLRNINK